MKIHGDSSSPHCIPSGSWGRTSRRNNEFCKSSLQSPSSSKSVNAGGLGWGGGSTSLLQPPFRPAAGEHGPVESCLAHRCSSRQRRSASVSPWDLRSCPPATTPLGILPPVGIYFGAAATSLLLGPCQQAQVLFPDQSAPQLGLGGFHAARPGLSGALSVRHHHRAQWTLQRCRDCEQGGVKSKWQLDLARRTTAIFTVTSICSSITQPKPSLIWCRDFALSSAVWDRTDSRADCKPMSVISAGNANSQHLRLKSSVQHW